MADFIDDYVAATAAMASPEIYRTWGAITAVSGALERKVWTAGSSAYIYPNMFTLLVGPPASGKSNAIRPIREIWSKVKGLHLAPDNVTKAALIDALYRALRTIPNGTEVPEIFTAMSAACSEFGVFIVKHDTEFLSVINFLWDSPDSYIEERRTMGKIEIIKPHLVMLAGTQPDFLNSVMPDEAWGMGFMSRLIMVFAPKAPIKSLFSGGSELDLKPFVESLSNIFEFRGEFVWSKHACREIDIWNESGCPPCPDHAKLLHYNARRAVHCVKLSMISAASRGQMLVTVEDFERAQSWLIDAEKTMPDIFRTMNHKADSQIISDMHFYMYRVWASLRPDKRRPLKTEELYKYLLTKVTADRINRIIEVAEKSGYFSRGVYPDEWIPKIIHNAGNLDERI